MPDSSDTKITELNRLIGYIQIIQSILIEKEIPFVTMHADFGKSVEAQLHNGITLIIMPKPLKGNEIYLVYRAVGVDKIFTDTFAEILLKQKIHAILRSLS